jgi:hypothetical protein
MIPDADDILPLLPVDNISAPDPAGVTAGWLAVRLGTNPADVRLALKQMERRGQANRCRTPPGPWLWSKPPEPAP